MDKCYKFASIMLKCAKYKIKDISIVPCCGAWSIETPKSKEEKSAHCKWCALAEVVASEEWE